MTVRVQCLRCGKTYDSMDTKHIMRDRKQMSQGIMSTLLIPQEECVSCQLRLPERNGYYANPVLIRFPSGCNAAG